MKGTSTGDTTSRTYEYTSSASSLGALTSSSEAPSSVNKAYSQWTLQARNIAGGRLTTGDTTKELSEKTDGSRRIYRGNASLDQNKIQKAIEVVEGVAETDVEDQVVRLNTLAGILSELWQSADAASTYHRQILAATETATNAAIKNSISQSQESSLRQALLDLMQPTLTQTNVDSISSYFIDEGRGPLAMLPDISDPSLLND